MSAATGFAAPRHGVTGIESPKLPGIATPVGESPWTDPLVKTARLLSPWIRAVEEVPVSGLHRRDKMVWEILGERGIPSFVVNWWATWPADEGPGFRMTERAFFRLEAGGDPDREVFPPEEYPRLLAAFPAFQAREAEDGSGGGDPASSREGRLLDDYHLATAREGWERVRFPFFALYLNGADVIGDAAAGEGQAARIARSRLLLEHLDRLDRSIGEWVRSLAPSDILVIQSDPGRAGAPRSGFVLLRGGGIRAGIESAGSLLDLAPTLLRLAGLPQSSEMEGHPRSECFDPAGPLAATPPPVASYGERRPPGAGSRDFDPEVLEKLRSLGYLR